MPVEEGGVEEGGMEEGGVEEGGMEEGRGWWGTRERLGALQCVDNSRLHQQQGILF